ncbi:hypothetical protein [Aquimarina spinulae]|uniref:hypothetical protein n=1 Tax=Aquimarina spinulae TaxID=1192023 RepID=UPI000D55DB92|nr:hypothetical protein [Aquimarina spinulae]
MIFKKKVKDYSKETIFKFYSCEKKTFLDFHELIKNDVVIESIVTNNDEYFSGFKQIIDNESNDGLIINLENDYSLHLSKIDYNDTKIFCCSYYFSYNNEMVIEIENFVSRLNNICYAVLTNYYDVKWQDEESILFYEMNNKTTKGLSFNVDFWDKKCIDISKNYGRSIFKGGISYIAGYCSWFGEIIDEGFIKKLDFVYKLNKMNNGLFKVLLFENINDDYSKHRDKQKKMLKTLDLI